MIMRMVMAALIALSLVKPAIAEDAAGIQAVISGQLAAFRADDAGKAFSFAAPSIRAQFKTPENFMAMVRQGYGPLVDAQSYRFGPLGDHYGATIQIVEVIGADGLEAHALYIMERNPGGGWRIAGCMLREPPGQGV